MQSACGSLLPTTTEQTCMPQLLSRHKASRRRLLLLQVASEGDRAKGGVRIRLKHYFARQKSGISQQGSDASI